MIYLQKMVYFDVDARNDDKWNNELKNWSKNSVPLQKYERNRRNLQSTSLTKAYQELSFSQWSLLCSNPKQIKIILETFHLNCFKSLNAKN